MKKSTDNTNLALVEQEVPAEVGTASYTLGQIRDVAFVIAIYLYFTGFTYSYAFADAFGIPFDLSTKPIYQLFIYSYGVIQDNWLSLVSIVGALVAFNIVLTWLRVRNAITARLEKSLKQGSKLFLAVTLFPLLNSWAFADAELTSIETRDGVNVQLVKFLFKRDRKNIFDKTFLAMNETMDLVLLGENAENYFVLRQSPSEPVVDKLARRHFKLAHGYVYALRKADVTTYVSRLDEGEYNAP